MAVHAGRFNKPAAYQNILVGRLPQKVDLL